MGEGAFLFPKEFLIHHLTLWQELTALDKIGYGADFVEQLPLPFPVASAVRIEHQAQIDQQS